MGKAIEPCIYPEPATKTLPEGFRVRKQVRDQWKEQRCITEIFRPANESAQAREAALQDARNFVAQIDREKRTGEIYRRFPEQLNPPPPKIVWRTTLPWNEWTPSQQVAVNEELEEEYRVWREQQPERKMRHYVEQTFLPWFEENNSRGDYDKHTAAWRAFAKYSDAETRDLPSKSIHEIRTSDIDDFVDWMERQREPDGEQTFAHSTITGYYGKIRSLFKHWAAHEKAPNPADPALLRTDTARVGGRKASDKVPTEEELALLVATTEVEIEKYREKYKGRFLFARIIVRYLTTLLLGTGTRIGEAMALHIDEFDFEAMTLTIQHSWDGKELGWTKTGKRLGSKEAGTRVIPLASRVADAVREWIEVRTQYGYPSIEECGVVFCDLDGSYFTSRRIRRYYKNICDAAKSPLHIRSHMLRHACNDRLRRAGVDVEVRNALVGHQDDETNRGYTSPKAMEAREALDSLG